MALGNLSVPPWSGFDSPDSVGALLPTHLHGSWVGASLCPASSEYKQRNVALAPVFVGAAYLLCYYEIKK